MEHIITGILFAMGCAIGVFGGAGLVVGIALLWARFGPAPKPAAPRIMTPTEKRAVEQFEHGANQIVVNDAELLELKQSPTLRSERGRRGGLVGTFLDIPVICRGEKPPPSPAPPAMRMAIQPTHPWPKE